MLNRETYWQCALVIPKGGFEALRQAGMNRLRQTIASAAPHVADRLTELKTWEDVRLLTVQVDRLKRWWKPGLLCIGDSAHAMSPIGGVGINLAIQDAVAAANLLWSPLKTGTLTTADLARVEARRRWPTALTQRIQLLIQDRILRRLLQSQRPITALPLPLRCLRRWPLLRRLPAYAIGIGARPEHIRSPEANLK
jgi:2-polyprenyl-6-methoxyphenol hydroxylase-like FAD-dependent oxidoreductase